MKSIVEEASSIVKAIEAAWIRAEKPSEFSVKIFEEPEKNFFGMVTKSAKIALIYKNIEKKAPYKEQTPAPKHRSAPAQETFVAKEPYERTERRERREPMVREPRETREPREPRESRETREYREPRELREPREQREFREPREPREVREPREPREQREPRERTLRSASDFAKATSDRHGYFDSTQDARERDVSDEARRAKTDSASRTIVRETTRKEQPYKQSATAREQEFAQEQGFEGTEQNQQEKIFWNDEMIGITREWIETLLANMDCGHIPFTLEAKRYYLTVAFEKPVRDTKAMEQQLFRSCAYLIMQMLRTKLKKQFRGLKVVLHSPA